MTDRTRKRNFAEKKTLSISAATVTAEDFDGTEDIELFLIPENSLVEDMYLVKDETGTGGTLTVNVGSSTFTSSASSASVTHNTTNRQITTETTVSLSPSSEVSSGKYTVIAKYIEYSVGNGMLTNYAS